MCYKNNASKILIIIYSDRFSQIIMSLKLFEHDFRYYDSVGTDYIHTTTNYGSYINLPCNCQTNRLTIPGNDHYCIDNGNCTRYIYHIYLSLTLVLFICYISLAINVCFLCVGYGTYVGVGVGSMDFGVIAVVLVICVYKICKR